MRASEFRTEVRQRLATAANGVGYGEGSYGTGARGTRVLDQAADAVVELVRSSFADDFEFDPEIETLAGGTDGGFTDEDRRLLSSLADFARRHGFRG
jgi:hypothetical protein